MSRSVAAIPSACIVVISAASGRTPSWRSSLLLAACPRGARPLLLVAPSRQPALRRMRRHHGGAAAVPAAVLVSHIALPAGAGCPAPAAVARQAALPSSATRHLRSGWSLRRSAVPEWHDSIALGASARERLPAFLTAISNSLRGLLQRRRPRPQHRRVRSFGALLPPQFELQIHSFDAGPSCCCPPATTSLPTMATG